MSEFQEPEIISLPQLKQILNTNLPDPEALNYYILREDRKLYLEGEIDDYTIPIQQLILYWNLKDKDIEPKNRKPIIIYIMSDGGYLDYMWMLVDAISMSKTPIYTVCLNKASSAAAIIFLAGHKRFMTPHSKLIVHEGSAQFGGDAVKVMDATESYKKELRTMKEYILSRTKIERSALMKKKANDWELSAEFCLNNGACEAIVDSFDEII